MEKEAQVHRVETEEDSGLYKANKGRAILTRPDLFKNENWTPFHLYITVSQEVESIKDGDWFIAIDDSIQFKRPKQNSLPNDRKIIATTDKKLILKGECDCMATTYEGCSQCLEQLPQIPQSFIKEYCEQSGIDKVLVKCYFKGERCALCGFTRESNECINRKECPKNYFGGELKIKLNQDNTIIISPINEKMYSRSEVVELIKKHADFIDDTIDYDGILNSTTAIALPEWDDNTWIKENL